MKQDGLWRERYGPWALVTGASEGIGCAMAQEIASRGVHLILVARRKDRLDALAETLKSTTGVQVRVCAADLSTAEGTRSVLLSIEGLELGLFVAAAGFGTSGAFLDSRIKEELDMLSVNCRAVLEILHPILREMKLRRRGGVVLLSSLVAFQGVPQAAHYAATKAYIQSLSEGIAGEARAEGIDVLASAPGPVHSGFADRAGMKMGQAAHPKTVAAATLNALGKSNLVRPGFLAKFLELALKTLPRRARVWVMGQIMSGMAGPQRPQPLKK